MGAVGLSACQPAINKDWDELHNNFQTPPESSRPGVYWYFMDGNISKEGMTKDLEAMKQAGIGSVVFLEVNVGIPRGKVDFFSEEWKLCFKHAVKECERLGISMTLGIGPGWTGSGGPWIKAEQSMRHLVASSTRVKGSGKQQTIRLAQPSPKAPYFGEGAFTPELKKQWEEYYEDVAVLAFPSPGELSRIKDIGEKAQHHQPVQHQRPRLSIEQQRAISQRDGVQPDAIVAHPSYFHVLIAGIIELAPLLVHFLVFPRKEKEDKQIKEKHPHKYQAIPYVEMPHIQQKFLPTVQLPRLLA